MPTRVDGVYFRMERRGDGFFQTGVQAGRSQSEPFDLVIGSGRRGQTYLYWRDGLLFQLPVSYHVASKRWINSPGYEDGIVNFGRGIPPQCLDCHASGFRLERTLTGERYAQDHRLGIGCEKCHGQAADHKQADHKQIVRPSGIDLCARCHSGSKDEPHAVPDAHGNQVGLLKSSKCFQKSGSLTCGTCHNVHRMERDPAVLSAKCGVCHGASTCKRGGPTECVSCHMPLAQSRLIEVQTYRTHRIAVYRR